jgi:hypothetical protein
MEENVPAFPNSDERENAGEGLKEHVHVVKKGNWGSNF